jgi:hypothetical protein
LDAVTPSRTFSVLPVLLMKIKNRFRIFFPSVASERNSLRFRSLRFLGKEWFFKPLRYLHTNSSSRKPLSSSCPSPVDDSSSTLGGHPLQKSVFPSSFKSTGLKCSFHLKTS